MSWFARISTYIGIKAPEPVRPRSTGSGEVSDTNTPIADTVSLSRQSLSPSLQAKLDKTITSVTDLDTYSRNANEFIAELRTLSPDEQTQANSYLRQEFYHALRNNNPINCAAYGALLDAETMLPVTAEEKALVRSFTVKIMDIKTVDFINKFIKSKRFSWANEGVSYADGRIPNNKLSCIAFVFEYLRSAYGSGAIQNVGRRQTINLAYKTAEDLPDMFNTTLAKPIEVTSEEALFNTIINDVNRDGASYYLCQAYNYSSIQIEGEAPIQELSPRHAFIIVGTKTADGQVNAFVLESSPVGDNRPRAISLVEKIKLSRYNKITMTNILPDDPADQVSILLQGISGKNLPKGKTFQQ